MKIGDIGVMAYVDCESERGFEVHTRPLRYEILESVYHFRGDASMNMSSLLILPVVWEDTEGRHAQDINVLQLLRNHLGLKRMSHKWKCAFQKSRPKIIRIEKKGERFILLERELKKWIGEARESHKLPLKVLYQGSGHLHSDGAPRREYHHNLNKSR